MKDKLIEIINSADYSLLSYLTDCIAKYRREDPDAKPNNDWRTDAPTDNQKNAIIKLQEKLKLPIDVPKTKGECSDLIGTLKDRINNVDTFNKKFNQSNSTSDDMSFGFSL